jgi:hypothetical protein
VEQEVGGVLVDTIGTGTLKLLLSGASRKKADSQCPSAASGQHIPDAVTDDNAVVDWDIETLSRSDKEVGVRLSMAD